MFRTSGRGPKGFIREVKGNVAILFGLALIPLALGVGIAIDYGRALIVREHMADAADAAALAIGSWPGLTQDEQKLKAQQFFDANFPPTKIGTIGKLDVQFDGDDIHVTVSGDVPTTFMKLANIETIGIGITNTITKKERNIELVLVLDTTGSMGSGGKLNAMKSAAKQMVDTLFEGKATSTTLKIGVVPFSVAVNIGSDKLNSGWLDKATYSAANASSHPIAFEDFDKTNGVSALAMYSKINRSWSGCVRERAGNAYELTDEPPSSGTPASLWVPYFAPDEPSKTSGSKCSTDTSYANDYICEANQTATCVNPPPSGASNAQKEDYQRQCYTSKYKSFSGSGGPDYNCPPANSKVAPLTDTRSTVTTAIDALAANGNTVIPSGLLWGWRVLSPTEPFTEGAAYNDDKWIKALVLLTDGENDVSGGGNGINESVYGAFGYAKSGHLGNSNGSNAEATLDAKTLAVCTAIKNASRAAGGSEDIRLYTIGFQVTTASKTLLKNCASKPDMFYDSPTNDQLAGIFQDIAQGLSELRIAQ
jgi:Flp pilus assembly protein TadG